VVLLTDIDARRCDVVRNQVGLLDYSGRDLLGGPPEDPSVPMYSSSLVSDITVHMSVWQQLLLLLTVLSAVEPHVDEHGVCRPDRFTVHGGTLFVESFIPLCGISFCVCPRDPGRR